MPIKNLYYVSDRQSALESAGLKIKDKLLELKIAGTDKEIYSNDEVINAVIEVNDLMPLTTGEIHFMCEIAGVEYIQES